MSQPLTYEEIKRISQESHEEVIEKWRAGENITSLENFVRSIEKAHGIGK